MKIILTGTLLLTHFFLSAQKTLHITEFMPFPQTTIAAENWPEDPWIEVQNISAGLIHTRDFSIKIIDASGSRISALPERTLLPGEVTVFFLNSTHNGTSNDSENLPLTIESGKESIIILNSNGQVEDMLETVNPVEKNEVWVRSLVDGSWSIFSGNMSSPGEPNVINVNWSKIASVTSLPAADSEPNACLHYKGKLWILGGWRYVEQEGKFSSSSYLYNSEDGIHWAKISDSLPFSHYSAYVVFRDTMWVYTNYEIYSSTDGLVWTERGRVPYDFFGTTSRLAVLKDKLYFVDTAYCGVSSDGIQFKTAEHAIPRRYFAALKPMGDKLFYFGGKDPQKEQYHTDVWTSENGLHWNRLADSVPWKPRIWMMSEVYQDKLWIFGGYKTPDYETETYANLNDIWYTEDGKKWEKYVPVNPWPIRHAAYHAVMNNKVFMIGGFDNAEKRGLFNDVWTFELRNYYLRPGGIPDNVTDWSATRDFSGPHPPVSMTGMVNYHIATQDAVQLSAPFRFASTAATLIVGNGIGNTTLTLYPESDLRNKVMVTGGSTLRIINQQPEFEIIPMTGSTIAFAHCPKLQLSQLPPFHHLELRQSRVILTESINVLGNFAFDSLSLQTPSENIPFRIRLKGDLTLGVRNDSTHLQIVGENKNDQLIFTDNNRQVSAGNLTLIKAEGNFILKGDVKVDHSLRVLHHE